MSGLDGQVKHLLEPMMLGKPQLLARVQCRGGSQAAGGGRF
jgi:hypothetical protein